MRFWIGATYSISIRQCWNGTEYVATWFHDQEIHDFIGANLHMVNNLTAGHTTCLDQKKRAGHDWRQYFFDRFCHGTVLQTVQQLENDNSLQER